MTRAEEKRELEIVHAMSMLSDLIPYDDPDYQGKLRRMAEGVVGMENDPNLISLCEVHDKLLDELEL